MCCIASQVKALRSEYERLKQERGDVKAAKAELEALRAEVEHAAALQVSLAKLSFMHVGMYPSLASVAWAVRLAERTSDGRQPINP